MRKPGFNPAYSSIQLIIEVVVVLPWVPATAMTQRSARRYLPNHSAPEVYATLPFITVSSAGFPLGRLAFPTMTSSVPVGMHSVVYPLEIPIPAPSSWVLMGGYTFSSVPVTWCPSSLANNAMLPINVPQIPRICIFMFISGRG